MAKHNIKTKKIWKDLSYDAKVLFDQIREGNDGDVVYSLSDMEIVSILHFVEILARRRKEASRDSTWTEVFHEVNLLALKAYHEACDPPSSQ